MTKAAPQRPPARRPKASSATAEATTTEVAAEVVADAMVEAIAVPLPADSGAAIDLGVLDESVGFLLKRAQMAVFTDFIQTFADVDIRPAQFSVLTVIGRTPGLKQSQVSNALSIKRTNFVPLLDALEARGLVKRKLATTDRRSHALHLTAKGTALMKRLNLLWTQHEQRISDRIGAQERKQLLALLGRLVDFGGPVPSDETDTLEAPAKPRKSPARSPRKAEAAAPRG